MTWTHVPLLSVTQANCNYNQWLLLLCLKQLTLSVGDSWHTLPAHLYSQGEDRTNGTTTSQIGPQVPSGLFFQDLTKNCCVFVRALSLISHILLVTCKCYPLLLFIESVFHTIKLEVKTLKKVLIVSISFFPEIYFYPLRAKRVGRQQI